MSGSLIIICILCFRDILFHPVTAFSFQPGSKKKKNKPSLPFQSFVVFRNSLYFCAYFTSSAIPVVSTIFCNPLNIYFPRARSFQGKEKFQELHRLLPKCFRVPLNTRHLNIISSVPFLWQFFQSLKVTSYYLCFL